ncbi:MAG: helix-turn-helix transcriptional regulator [Bacteroidales bacterium]|nr:helix-turn-helix transcriptional regulator [Bacteroidales bacterium]
MSKKESKSVLNHLLQDTTPEKQRRTDNKMLLAVKIKETMDAKGWKKADLARALNKEKSVITLWLSGTHNFKIDTLSDIESVLQVKLLNVK